MAKSNSSSNSRPVSVKYFACDCPCVLRTELLLSQLPATATLSQFRQHISSRSRYLTYKHLFRAHTGDLVPIDLESSLPADFALRCGSVLHAVASDAGAGPFELDVCIQLHSPAQLSNHRLSSPPSFSSSSLIQASQPPSELSIGLLTVSPWQQLHNLRQQAVQQLPLLAQLHFQFCTNRGWPITVDRELHTQLHTALDNRQCIGIVSLSLLHNTIAIAAAPSVAMQLPGMHAHKLPSITSKEHSAKHSNGSNNNNNHDNSNNSNNNIDYTINNNKRPLPDGEQLPLFVGEQLGKSTAKQMLISYVRAEAQHVAIALKEKLTELGCSVFLDVDEIELGSDWQDALNDAVTAAEVFIPLVTQRYGATQWTNREVKLADVLGKEIMPVNFLDDWPPKCLAIQFATTQFVPWLGSYDADSQESLNLEASRVADEIRRRFDRTKRPAAAAGSGVVAMETPASNSINSSSSSTAVGRMSTPGTAAPVAATTAASAAADRNAAAAASVAFDTATAMPSTVQIRACRKKPTFLSIMSRKSTKCKQAVAAAVAAVAPAAAGARNQATEQMAAAAAAASDSSEQSKFCDDNSDIADDDDDDGSVLLGYDHKNNAASSLHRSESAQTLIIDDEQDSYSCRYACSDTQHDRADLLDFQSQADAAGAAAFIISEAFLLARASRKQIFYCEQRKHIIPIVIGDLPLPLWLRVLLVEDDIVNTIKPNWVSSVADSLETLFDPNTMAYMNKSKAVDFKLDKLGQLIRSQLPTDRFLIFICRSAQVTNARTALVCQALGQSLAKLKWAAVVTSCAIGASHIVSSSFCKQRQQLQLPADTWHLRQQQQQQQQQSAAESAAPSFGKTLLCGDSTAELLNIAAKVCSLCLLIEGRERAIDEADRFMWHDKVVLPVKSLGGAAATYFADSERRFEVPPGVSRKLWSSLSVPLDCDNFTRQHLVDNIVQIIQCIRDYDGSGVSIRRFRSRFCA